jgi:tRNA pseudouridine65 synthase
MDPDPTCWNIARASMSPAAIPIDFWNSLPLGRGVSLLEHDSNGVAALAKPAGTLSHPNRSGEEGRALLQARYTLESECFEWPDPLDGAAPPRRLWLLNRLDSATSGVILVAAGEQLAREIRALFRAKHVHKVYAALVFGRPAAAQQVWRDRLAIDKRGGQVRTTTGGQVPAEALMRLIESSPPRTHPPLSLIQLEPRTGRSHQLRAQCARRHLPIVGDATYGEFGLNRDLARRTGEKRLFLHSLETTFDYPWAGRVHRFAAHAPLPAAFPAVLRSTS